MLLPCSPLYSQTGISQGNWDMRKAVLAKGGCRSDEHHWGTKG